MSNEKIIKVFTDGSFMKRNGGKGGYGIHFPNKELDDVSRPFRHSPITNQRSELYAIYVALIKIKKHLEFDKIIVYSDSGYSIKCVTEWCHKWKKNDWKTADNKIVKNQDILKPLCDIVSKLKEKVQFIHVYSHTGKTDELSKGNDVADQLATNGALKK